jgi:hypothetical protein
MKRRWAGGLAASILLALGAGVLAQPRQEPPQVDYWQPLWMQRELWGPGTMPPGMRARVLRHHTFMQFGVQAEYQGAKPTVGSDESVIKEGAKLYAARALPVTAIKAPTCRLQGHAHARRDLENHCLHARRLPGRSVASQVVSTQAKRADRSSRRESIVAEFGQ